MNVKRLEWKKLHRNRMLVATGASLRYAIASKLIFDENDKPATAYSVIVAGMQSGFDDNTIDNAVPNHSTLESAIEEANSINRKDVLAWILPEQESEPEEVPPIQWTQWDKEEESWTSECGEYTVMLGVGQYEALCGIAVIGYFPTMEAAMEGCERYQSENKR